MFNINSSFRSHRRNAFVHNADEEVPNAPDREEEPAGADENSRELLPDTSSITTRNDSVRRLSTPRNSSLADEYRKSSFKNTSIVSAQASNDNDDNHDMLARDDSRSFSVIQSEHPNPSENDKLLEKSSSFPLPATMKKVEIIDDPCNMKEATKKGNDAFQSMVTLKYCKLMIILGLAFPMSEVLSEKVPRGFYQFFYVYLFLGSLGFLTYIYIDLARTKAQLAVKNTNFDWFERLTKLFLVTSNFDQEAEDLHVEEKRKRDKEMERLIPRPKQVYGSLYTRMGAVLFGIGSLIYSGIEIGVFFEIGFEKTNSNCKDVLILVRPFLQITFVFIQMYFIFLNHKMNIYKNKLVSRFGLMHMIATNICIWFNVLILETYHEIHEIQSKKLAHNTHSTTESHFNEHTTESHLNAHENTSKGHKFIQDHTEILHKDIHKNSSDVLSSSCLRSKVMGTLLENSGPFLFPCTIEYSLICAAVLYMMWKNTFDEHEHYKSRKMRNKISCRMQIPLQRTREELEMELQRNQYSVDCSNANTGLFCGIFVMVVTVISLIVFFVLITSENEKFNKSAITVASLTELILYSLATVAVIIGMIQIRKLWYDSSKKLELDNLLLVVAQTGVLIYSSFCIIGNFFQWREHLVSFFASVVTLCQTLLQTTFILDASNRFAYCEEQVKEKPGRQLVTFLLVTNLAMWAINTLETNRADSHPIQVNFYGGDWVWPIITHVSMPLAIFYRFHSTVCLCEIWTKTFRYKEQQYIMA